MAKDNDAREKIAYFIFEGDTEDVFFKSVLDKYLDRGIKRKYKNLETGSGINNAVASYLHYFLRENSDKSVYAYVFIDREGSRSKMPEFNGKLIKSELDRSLGKTGLNRVGKIEAVQMIESWFFHDLEGICKYIGIPYTDSLQRNYANPEMFTSRDLAKLFTKGEKKKHYKKGDKGFLDKLNIEKIYENCKDLKEGIEMINRDFAG